MNTEPGFYKLEDGVLIYGPNFVLNTNYHLIKENKDSYTYPTYGWYWFDTENEAREFFGLPPIVIETQPPFMDL